MCGWSGSGRAGQNDVPLVLADIPQPPGRVKYLSQEYSGWGSRTDASSSPPSRSKKERPRWEIVARTRPSASGMGVPMNPQPSAWWRSTHNSRPAATRHRRTWLPIFCGPSSALVRTELLPEFPGHGQKHAAGGHVPQPRLAVKIVGHQAVAGGVERHSDAVIDMAPPREA